MAAQGRDIKLSENRVEGYRNFSTKIWNAARFCEMNGCKLVDGFDPTSVKNVVNRWIVSRLGVAIGEVEQALDAYRFNEAASALYQFAWGTYCDWYLEFAKPLFQGSDTAAMEETRATAAWVLGQLLHALHPLMPFMTEELWEHLTEGKGKPLIAAEWPKATTGAADAADEMDWVIRLISEIRTVRVELNVPPAAKLDLYVKDADAVADARMLTHGHMISHLARLEAIHRGTEIPKGAVEIVVGTTIVALPLAGVVDVAKEKARLEKDDAKLAGEVTKIEKKLGNADFVAKAPEEVVVENRDRLAELAAERAKIKEALTRLAAL
jgi:valyl-tRNA synthetase